MIADILIAGLLVGMVIVLGIATWNGYHDHYDSHGT